MTTLGVGPVLMETGAITQGGVSPAKKQVRLSEPSRFGFTSTINPMFVLLYATTPRCVPGSIPREKGAGSPVAEGWPNNVLRSIEIDLFKNVKNGTDLLIENR